MFDSEVISCLWEILGGLIGEVIWLFFEDMLCYLVELERGIVEGNIDMLCWVMYVIKGVVSNFGVFVVVGVVGKME